MKTRRAIQMGLWTTAISGLLAIPGQALAVPTTIPQQGRLFSEDAAVTGTRAIQLALYDAPTGSAPIWSEAQDVEFDDGYFSIELGSTMPLSSDLFDGGQKYLGITIGSDAEMAPRAAVGSVPYALVCEDARGDITPKTISIAGYGSVIDANGKWVGDPENLAGPKGEKGDSGAFPGTLYPKGGNNGTVSCEGYCNDFGDNWAFVPSGACVGARIDILANPSPLAAKSGKYIPCGMEPAVTFGGDWVVGVDSVTCWCIHY